MNNRERMFQKIEAEPDQGKRLMMYVAFLCEYASKDAIKIIVDAMAQTLEDGANVTAIHADARVRLEKILAAA